jgi:hypothetical protein
LSFNYFTWLIAEEDFIETILIYNIVAWKLFSKGEYVSWSGEGWENLV